MPPPAATALTVPGMNSVPLLTSHRYVALSMFGALNGETLPPAENRSSIVRSVHRVNQVAAGPVAPLPLACVSLRTPTRPASTTAPTARSPSVRMRNVPSPGAKLTTSTGITL